MLISNLFFVNMLFSNTFQSMHQKESQNQKPTMQFSLALHMLHQVTAPFFSQSNNFLHKQLQKETLVHKRHVTFYKKILLFFVAITSFP